MRFKLGLAFLGMALWHFIPVFLGVVYVIALNVFVFGDNDTQARDLRPPEWEDVVYIVIAFGVWRGLLISGLTFVLLAWILLGEAFSDPNWEPVLLSGFVGTAVATVGGAATVWFAVWLLWPIAEVIGAIVAYSLVELYLARRHLRATA